MNVKVSVVTTEKNEAGSIKSFMMGILNQTYPVDELIICDGGSTDGTIEIIQEYQAKHSFIKLIIKTGNISVGRNEAIRKAQGKVIAVTDVGTTADKDWLRCLMEPFEKDPHTQVVGGFFKSAPQSFFEEVSALLMLSDHDQIDPETWLPSSRSIAFTKKAWEKVGGYPEHTSYNEDTPFDLSLKKAGFQFVFAPKAIVYWRPRPDLRGFFNQYYNYAIGDGLDLIHAPNYFRKILFYLFLLLLLGFVVVKPVSFLFLTGVILLYWLRRSRHLWKKSLSLRWILYVPLIIGIKDVADLLGFMRGFLSKTQSRN